jgi:hypothetical protein
MKRQSRNLSSALEQRLNAYALAAGAAGVGVLALAHPAEGKIVYTSTHVVIPNGVRTYDLHLDKNGGTDFVLQTRFYSTTDQSAGTQRLMVSGLDGNSCVRSSHGFAAALKPGKSIGRKGNFNARAVMASDWGSAGASTSIKRGPWVNVNNRYLGLKFKIKGAVHYGWARLDVHAMRGYFYLQATLTGYAYETIPNKPIIAGKTKGKDVITVQPATLGTLALGRK